MTQTTKLPITIAKTAQYAKTDIKEYKENPLILALPARVTPERVYKIFTNTVQSYDWKSITLNEREEQVRAIRSLRIFSSQHLELYHTIYEMLRYGYVNRNPISPDVVAWSYDIADSNIPLQEVAHSQISSALQSTVADSLFLSGFSGNGKSTTIERILQTLFPTVIEHQWKNFTEPQIIYIKVDLPHNASRSGLICNLLQEVDRILDKTSYGNPHYTKAVKKKDGRFITIDSMMDILLNVLVRHHVGLIVIDEFQNMLVASQRYRLETIQLFDELANRLFIPNIKIGTPDTIMAFSKNSRHQRRLGQIFELQRLNDKKSNERAINALFKFQPLENPIEKNDDIKNLIMTLTAGVPAYLIGLWEASILFAIKTGKETLSTALIKKAFNQKYPLLKSVTRNINQGKKGRYADLLTVQQYLDTGNNASALKHLTLFAKQANLSGVAAEETIKDIDKMKEQFQFSDKEITIINKLKQELNEKKNTFNKPQTLEHEK